MASLYLHIGSHKTGTTSLQEALARSLDKRSASYVDIRRKETRLIKIRGSGPQFRADINVERAANLFASNLRKSSRKNTGKVFVASDEALFWPNDAEQVARLADALRSIFDSVTIICYLRRQTELAIAHRKQVIMGLPAKRFYGKEITPLPRYQPHFQDYFDYDRKLSNIWAPAFGADNVVAVPFERGRFQDGDVVKDFANRTGITFSRRRRADANTAMAGNQTYLGLVLKRAEVERDIRRRIVDKLRGEGHYLPSRKRARAFQAKFKDANQRLAQNWRCDGEPIAFEAGFERYPVEPERGPWDYSAVRSRLSKVLDKEAMAQLGL